jgi:hypothetical protein
MREFLYTSVLFVPDTIDDTRVALALLVVDPETGENRHGLRAAWREIVHALAPTVLSERLRLMDSLLHLIPVNHQGHDAGYVRGRLEHAQRVHTNQTRLSPIRSYRAPDIDTAFAHLWPLMFGHGSEIEQPERAMEPEPVQA